MNFFSQLRSRFRGRPRLAFTGIVVTGMLGLLILQLGWWLIFFEIRTEEYWRSLSANDFLRAALVNEERPEHLPGGGSLMDGLERGADGRFVLKEDFVAERRRVHDRRRIMLISETLFLILVLVYGHYRVIRALRREWRLVSDRNNLIQSVTHELKTPLAAALLHLQTLVKRQLDEPQRKEILDQSIDDLKRLEEQLNNLLTGSALLRGRDAGMAPARARADAAEQLRGYITGAAALARARKVELTLEAPDQLPVRLDANLLEKVISNLVHNAIQHSPPGGRVRVRLERQAVRRKFCVLTVRDEGPGLPVAERENVFQPLYRVEKPSAQAGEHTGGSGMGLYIVREILNAAGGSVRILPPLEGKGLVVEARLPRA